MRKTKIVTDLGLQFYCRLDVRYSDFRAPLFGLGLQRGVLFSEIYNACRSESRIQFETNCEVEKVDVGGESSTFEDRRGREYGPFDLLVIAGIFRQMLQLVCIPWRHWFCMYIE